MQILVQALFAESGAEGKKPGDHFQSGKEGDTFFAELILPEVETEAEPPLAAVLPELSVRADTVQIGSKHPFAEQALLESGPLPVPDIPDTADVADVEIASVSLEAEPLPGTEVVTSPLANSAVVDVVPVVSEGARAAPVLDEVRGIGAEVRAQVRPDVPLPQRDTQPVATAPEQREYTDTTIPLPKPDRIDLPLRNIEAVYPQSSSEPQMTADRALPLVETQTRTIEVPLLPGRPGLKDETGAMRPVFPAGRDGEPSRLFDRELAVHLPASSQSNAAAVVSATPAPVVFATQNQLPVEGPMQRELAAMAPEVMPGMTVSDGEEVRPQASTMPRAEALARPVMQQVHQLILRSNMDGLVEVKLSPEELGRVKLSMSQVEAGIAVHITAERPETLDLMRRNIDMLENDLRDQGFENLNFSFDQDGQEDRDSGSSASLVSAEQKPGVRAEVVTAPTNITPDGHVDIRL